MIGVRGANPKRKTQETKTERETNRSVFLLGDGVRRSEKFQATGQTALESAA